ncbi:hypothetical protein PRIO_5836 [Paenibacillus riograndensis SBR5]|uniref:Uncharacterized protein n=1 Tax=Paenibacillus riograndensis SBR5 TaxID=1073571 RepID=A0A0E3WJ60_9BACL|nr:hypothetical protein PRIO_5836 [Paenibacillus riograndensis SBR5]
MFGFVPSPLNNQSLVDIRRLVILLLLHRKSLITDHILYNKKRPPNNHQGERLVYALQNRYFPFLRNAYRK